MREYRYPATEATIATLRHLRGPWAGYLRTDEALVVAFPDGSAVRIAVEGVRLEPNFEAFRLTAAPVEAPAEPLTPAGTFGDGRNDIVVFTSETWIEGPGASGLDGVGPDAVVQFTGSRRQRSSSAEAVCAVDDAIVVATGAGTGVLIRCALRPHALEVTLATAAIAQFLAERQYGADAADA